MRNHTTLPTFVRDMLNSPPRAGEGVHKWLFRISRQLHAHLPAGRIVTLLEDLTQNCGRVVPRDEIVDAVQNSLAVAWRPATRGVPIRRTSSWPSVSQDQREAIFSGEIGLVDLWELSPVRIDDIRNRTEEIIDRLFQPESLLCCGR